MRGAIFAFVTLLAIALGAAVPQPDLVSITTSYFIEDGKGVAGFEAADPELAEMALRAWAKASGGRLKFVRTRQASNAVVRIRWISPDQGLYGEMERVWVNGKPGAIVNVSPAVAALGEPFGTLTAQDRLLRDCIVYLTCLHEIGHAIGLGHTRNFQDIMYAFGYGGDIVEYFSRYRRSVTTRRDIESVSGLSAEDIEALRVALEKTAAP